ncbi:hypothetical protein P9F83_09315 [Peribacillus psychrosaccharolyticus]|nr:hypothetical protein [Peribacillus psychrosaccharolyticus]MEC2055426.1 hypothetical protein [Peribacillus psychrosaccharolyticus]MED3743544.1 hypothetical protein [Peribacillus psychrosaccharolyticus]
METGSVVPACDYRKDLSSMIGSIKTKPLAKLANGFHPSLLM